MAAPTRHRYRLPNGEDAVLAVSVGDSFGGKVLDNNSPRDISSDTLTVSAKLDTTTKTLTIAATASQAGSSKGRYIVTIPAAQIGAAGELYVDVKNQKTGEEAKIIDRWQFTVEDSAAD